MNRTVGVSGLVGLSVAALGVGIGAITHDGAAFERPDVALTAFPGVVNNPADEWHNTLVQSQVDLNQAQYDNYVLGLQQSIYDWVGRDTENGGLGLDADKWLFIDPDASPASTGLFNGAFTRFGEALLVGQAIQQAQWDHLLGVNQTGGEAGYETAIAESLLGNIAGSGVSEDSGIGSALAALGWDFDTSSFDPTGDAADVLGSASGFQDALGDLQGALFQAGFSDLLGMFSVADLF